MNLRVTVYSVVGEGVGEVHGQINNSQVPRKGGLIFSFWHPIWYVKGGLDCSTFEVFKLNLCRFSLFSL